MFPAFKSSFNRLNAGSSSGLGTIIGGLRGHTVLLIGGLLWLLAACSPTPGPDQVTIVPPTTEPGRPLSDQPTVPATHPTPTDVSLQDTFTVDGEERRFIELFRASNPSVVHVHVERRRPDTAMEEFRRRMLQAHQFAGFRGQISDPDGGSGFVFDDGLILTTNRIVKDAREIQITFADGTGSPAAFIGADPNTDLAVLKVSQLPATVKPLQIGDSDSLQVGQRVIALGNPLGHGGAMTAGVVSAKARNVSLEIQIDSGFFTAPDLIQTDAAILAGTVGGPLIDLDGEVVGVLGIDTLEYDAAGAMPAGGVGFSIPTSTVRRVVPVLLEEGRYPYPWLGIRAADMDPDVAQVMGLAFNQHGVLVVRVTPDSPAEKAGLRGGDRQVPELESSLLIGGDVIVGFQGRPVRDFSELVSLLFREGTVGETVTLSLIRDGEQIEVPLRLEERPQ